jgi:hypothetical protein
MNQLFSSSNRLAVGCLFVLLTAGLATPLHAITNGQFDGTEHPYVGVCQTTDVDVYPVQTCSGFLISPWVFVTAGHCVYDEEPVILTTSTDAFAPDAVFVTGTGHQLNDPFCIGCGTVVPHATATDVAVIALDEPIFVSRYAELPDAGLVDTLPVGQLLTVVGYGTQHVDPSTKAWAPYLDGKRHSAIVKFDGSAASFSSFLKISLNPGQGKGGTCIIDSGGPALFGDTVLGVISGEHSPLCTGVGYDYRLDQASVLTFIRSFLP